MRPGETYGSVCGWIMIPTGAQAVRKDSAQATAFYFALALHAIRSYTTDMGRILTRYVHFYLACTSSLFVLQKWDRYLAKFADDLPNNPHRAGTFAPFVSLYDRIMGRERDFAPVVQDEKFPHDVLATEKAHSVTEVPVLNSHPHILRKNPRYLLDRTFPGLMRVEIFPLLTSCW